MVVHAHATTYAWAWTTDDSTDAFNVVNAIATTYAVDATSALEAERAINDAKFGQIWRTAVFRERFVVRYRRRIDGYTHSPLSSRFLEEWKVGGSHGLCPHMHICCVRPCEWVFSKVNTMFGEDQLSVLAD